MSFRKIFLKTRQKRITIFGLPYFSQHLAELINSSCSHLKAQFINIAQVRSLISRYFLLLKEITSCDLIYRVSGFPRKKIVCLTKLLNIPLIIHWVGTDVLRAKRHFKGVLKHYLNQNNLIHWAGAPWLVKELKDIHIESEFVPLPVSTVKEILIQSPPPFPENFTILSYLPDNRLKFYRSDYIVRLAKDFPEISFLIVGSSGKFLKDNFKNIKFLGWTSNMNEAYSQSTLFVRIVEHDGHPWTVKEALAMGRYVIWSYPLTGVFRVKNYKELHFHVNKLLNLHKEGKLRLNEEGRRYIKEKLNPQILTKQIIDNISQILNLKRK